MIKMKRMANVERSSSFPLRAAVYFEIVLSATEGLKKKLTSLYGAAFDCNNAINVSLMIGS